MDIRIPTYGRVDKQDTLWSIPMEWWDRTAIVSSRKEVDELRDRYPLVDVLECPVEGIGLKRQWILENSPEKVVMLDDDLRFAVRRDDDPTKFIPASEEDVSRALEDVERELDRYSHGSIAHREGANRDVSAMKYGAGRALRVNAYRADHLRDLGVRFDRLKYMEDFDVALQLYELGCPSFTVNWCVHDQGTSNAPGGCSEGRTPEAQAEAAQALHRLHPRFVKVVRKPERKGAWAGFGERTDVVISWKKALISANEDLL